MGVEEDIINKPVPLSEDQKKAVLSTERFVRVIAGAGAGKTETLTRRIIYLLLVKKVEPSAIVAFTFTEKAALSMKNRIYQRIQEHGREDIAKRLGEMYIGTIHGFCLRVLQEKFSDEGYGSYKVLDANREMAFLMRIGWGLGLKPGKKENYSQNCSDFLANVGVVYGEYLDKSLVKKKALKFYEKLVRYEERLDMHRSLTFGRIIYECVRRLEDAASRLDEVEYLIVDEFQDIDRAQFRLIEIIGQTASVFVVGDPRQSIYKWRGSNEEFFQNFGDTFNPVEFVEINENRRSKRKIVDISNAFADSFEGVSYDHMLPVRQEDGDVRTVALDTKGIEAEWVAEQIERLVKNGFQYSDFAILLRSVNTSATPFIDEFRERKIPYLVGGKVGLFKRSEAQAIGRLMAWLDEKGFWIENPYKPKVKVEGDDLLKTGIEYWNLAVDFDVPDDLEARLIDWKARVLDEELKTFKELFYELLVVLGYKVLDHDKPLHAAMAANIGRLSGMVQDFEMARRLVVKQDPNWKRDLHDFCWFMNSYGIKAYEEQTADDIRKVNAVQIMTVHQAKGLEWPVVFIPALVSRRFPSTGSNFKTEWELPDDLFDRERYEGTEEDEKRLFYVAMTRAMDGLVLSYFTHDSSRKRSRSKFIDILDDMLGLDGEGYSCRLDYVRGAVSSSDEIQTFSTTELINYMLCPHHYRLNQLWGYMQSYSPLIGYGETLHFSLRRAAELIKEEGYSPVSAVVTAVNENFYLPFANDELLGKIKNRARETLITFAKKHEDDMMNIDEVETRVEFPLENATLIGKVDVILKDGGALEIRDYKTSDKVIKKQDSIFQLLLYTMGLRDAGRDIQSGSIAYLDRAEVEPISLDEKKIKTQKDKAEEVIRRINSGEFPARARDADFCKKCEYRMICKGAK